MLRDMSTRIEALVSAAKLSRIDIAVALRCDTSTISRLLTGRRETPQQELLLDLLARDRGFPHLTAEAFATGSLLPAGGSPAAPVASPGDGGGVSSSEAGAA